MNPLNVVWNDLNNVKDCTGKNECTIKIKYPSGDMKWKTVKEEESYMYLTPTKAHICQTQGNEWTLEKVCISKKSLNYYNQGDSQKGENFIEMILVHVNKDPLANSSRLYMCFLLEKGQNPGGSDLDKKMTYDYFEKLAEGMKKKHLPLRMKVY